MMEMEIPKLKKIFALIPEELFQTLYDKSIINSDFDRWVTEAILLKLKEEDSRA